MAVPNAGQLAATVWEDYVKQDPTEQIFPRFWLLENLKEGQSFRKGAGDPIVGTIEYTLNTTVKSMGEMETLDVTRVDIFDKWQASWKLVGGLFVMSEYEKATQQGGAAKFPLEAAKMENLKKSIFNQLNNDLYSDGTGTGGKQATGLAALVSATPTTGTVENINAATFSFWRNQQASGAQSATAFDNLKGSMRSVYNLCSNGPGQETPDFAITTRTVFEGYEALSVAIERLDRNTVNDKALSGFKGTQIMFKDIPLAYDAACPSGLCYILNRRNLFIRYMLWMKAFSAASPVNQFIDAVKILTIYNLCTDNRRRLGVVTAIT